MTDSQHGRLIVLCGPAGVGKGTVLGRVREQHPEIWLSVSATTRQPRPGEVDGVNYFFMPEQEFLDKEAAGEFLETADVFGLAHYGTPVKPVVEHLERNIPVILGNRYSRCSQCQAACGGVGYRGNDRVHRAAVI